MYILYACMIQALYITKFTKVYMKIMMMKTMMALTVGVKENNLFFHGIPTYKYIENLVYGL